MKQRDEEFFLKVCRVADEMEKNGGHISEEYSVPGCDEIYFIGQSAHLLLRRRKHIQSNVDESKTCAMAQKGIIPNCTHRCRETNK